MPKIRLHRVHQNLWTNAGQHIHRKPGDLNTLTGLLSTVDRQELRRAPALSSHLTRPGLTAVEGTSHDAPARRIALIGQDASSQLACTLSPPPGPMPAPLSPSMRGQAPSTPPSPPWTASTSATIPTPEASPPTPASEGD